MAPYRPAKAWIEKDGSILGEVVSPNQHWPIYYENKRLEERIEIVDQYFTNPNQNAWVSGCPSGSVYFDSSHQLSVSMGWGQGSCWTGNTPNPNAGYYVRAYYYRSGWGYSYYSVLNHWAQTDRWGNTRIYGTRCNGRVSYLFWFDRYNYRGYVATFPGPACGGSTYLVYASPNAGLSGWNLINHPQYPGMKGMPWNHGVKNKYVSTVFDLRYWKDYGRNENIEKIGEWRDTEVLVSTTPGGSLTPVPNCIPHAQPVIPCPPTGHLFCGDDPSFPAPGNYCCLNCEQTAQKIQNANNKMKVALGIASSKAEKLKAKLQKITDMWDEIQ